MNNYKQIETAAAACRAVQLSIDEFLKLIRPHAENPITCNASFGFLTESESHLLEARAALRESADRLYKALEKEG